MRISVLGCIYLCFSAGLCRAQFDPGGGETGSRAIYVQNSYISSWAEKVVIQRGYVHIKDTVLGKASLGMPEDALGLADGITVSLGDGGMAEVILSNPLHRLKGCEFAVFENSFKMPGGYFVELAKVSVSSDGIHFYEFPGESLTQSILQLDNAGLIKPEQIHNLAGKHPTFWGTPFDVDELLDTLFLNKDSITHIRITDVIGSVDPEIGTKDSKGRLINDPWPTPFASGGFDLDAVAILSEGFTTLAENNLTLKMPNPVKAGTVLQISWLNETRFEWIDISGNLIEAGFADKQIPTPIKSGLYILKLQVADTIQNHKICVY